MTLAAHTLQNSPIEEINATLKGSVIDVLRLFVPSLAAYTNEEAFNVILNSPEMTQRSFRVFRDNPDAFVELMRGPKNQPVSTDNEMLSCGRTLAQIVALVVQAVAKRYFRAKLSLRRTQAKNSFLVIEKLTRFFKGSPPPKTPKGLGAGDRLFQALRDNLLFEWQLRLIPHYVGLPVALVRELGDRILDFTEIEDIQWMVRTGQPLPPTTAREPEMAEEPSPILWEATPPNKDTIKADTTKAVKKPSKPASSVLAQVNPALARRLAKELGLAPRQLALALIRANEALPTGEFQRFGASPPDSEEATRFIMAATITRFGDDTSPAAAAEFSRLYITGPSVIF